MNITTVLISLFIFLLLFGGGIVLQIYLSSRASKWPGLVLPALTFALSLVMLLQIVGPLTAQLVAAAFLAFLLSNIPTLVLLAIYAANRKKYARRTQLEKMSVQDLN